MGQHEHHDEFSQPSKDRLFVHEFDGIQEYDNPMPGWWKAIFWGSIVFSVWYLIHYHGGMGQSVEQEYNAAMTQVSKLQAEYNKKVAARTGTKALKKLLGKPEVLASGKQVFTTYCAVCHGPDGGGKTCPNLADDYWVNAPDLKSIFGVIYNGGREGKGMIAWNGTLNLKQMQHVTVYVQSLRGTKPKNAKEADKKDEKYFAPKKGKK